MKTEQWICLVYPTYIVSPQSGLYKNNVNEYVKGIAKQDVGTLVWIIPSLTDFSISNCVLVICNSLIGRLFYFQSNVVLVIFQELLLAAQWAKKHKVSFPPIDTTVFDREGMKEIYIFRHPTDSHCPIVLHFCLVNIEFRKFMKPGKQKHDTKCLCLYNRKKRRN